VWLTIINRFHLSAWVVVALARFAVSAEAGCKARPSEAREARRKTIFIEICSFLTDSDKLLSAAA